MFAPFGLPSENRTAEWRPEPISRGTFSLVSTCLITMALCIWTAVHLNIPEYGKSSKQSWRKILCIIVGLFAPELVCSFDREAFGSLMYPDCLDGLRTI